MQIVRIGGPKQTEATINLASTDAAATIETLGATVAKTQDGVVGGRPIKANGAYITVETANVRVGIGTVTTALGHLAGPGDVILLESQHEIENTTFISEVGGLSASLQTTVQYYR